MRIFLKQTTIFFLVLTFLAIPWCATASSETQESDYHISTAIMAGDAVIARPLGIASLAVGFGLFVVSSPFSALGGNFGDAWSTLVAKPAKFTFARPLGKFDTSPRRP